MGRIGRDINDRPFRELHPLTVHYQLRPTLQDDVDLVLVMSRLCVLGASGQRVDPTGELRDAQEFEVGRSPGSTFLDQSSEIERFRKRYGGKKKAAPAKAAETAPSEESGAAEESEGAAATETPAE